MEQNYSEKKLKLKSEGPSELTVKRILAFSKAYKTMNASKEAAADKTSNKS